MSPLARLRLTAPVALAVLAAGCGARSDHATPTTTGLPRWTAHDRLCAAASTIVVADVYPTVPIEGAVILRCLVLEVLKGPPATRLEVRHAFDRAPRRPARHVRGSLGEPADPAFPGAAEIESLTGRTMIAFLQTGPGGALELVDRGATQPTRRALVDDSPERRRSIRGTLTKHRDRLSRPLPRTELDDVVAALIQGMPSSGPAHDAAATQLSRLPRASLPAIVKHLGDERPLPVDRVMLTHPVTGHRVLPTRQVRDSLAAILGRITGEGFGFGISAAERSHSNHAWRVRARYAR